MKKLLLSMLFIAFGVLSFAHSFTAVSATDSKFVKSARSVPQRFIVALVSEPGSYALDSDVEAEAESLTSTYGGKVERVYSRALKGFAVEMDTDAAISLSTDPRVFLVEQDSEVSIDATQTNATWGLDRVDQMALPLNNSYSYDTAGSGVHVYIIDTGIRVTHSEFAGRAVSSFDALLDGQNGNDCNGHGTHVAGTIGGATYGVAKNVSLHGVRVLGCNGSGLVSDVLAGIDWVTANHSMPAVANMSIGGGASPLLDWAVENSISSGITYVVAAGNASYDACEMSPARTPGALTVGATDNLDKRADFSNFGACLDLFAPGVNVTSAWIFGDSGVNTISGTSMATPHVSGVAALYLGSNPTASASQVATEIKSKATANVVTNIDSTTANLLLYARLTPPPSVCDSGRVFTGTLLANQSVYQANALGFSANAGTFSALLRSTSKSAPTLKLEKKDRSTWRSVASVRTSNGNLNYNGTAGTYRWKVQSASTGGSYTLCSGTP
ncbi:MAG: S8 family peptidase [Acidobacteria bacterium]|nr:S8 family peptidase [Acidobacteriota bacterium]